MCVAFFEPRQLFRRVFVVGFPFMIILTGLLCFAQRQQPSQRTALTRKLHSEGTGFVTYCPLLTNLNDSFFFVFMVTGVLGNICPFRGLFFYDVANDVFIVYIFEFFQSYLLVLTQELTEMNNIGVRENLDLLPYEKQILKLQNLHSILFRKALSYIFFILFEEIDRQLQVDLNPICREKLSKVSKSHCNEKF